MSTLYVFALEEEAADLFLDLQCLFVGVGKVQATYQLTEAIHTLKPTKIINLGSAGSTHFKKGSVVNPTAFYQRDMDVTALGFDVYQTPFCEDEIPLIYGERVNHIPEAVCGSGDSFINVSSEDIPYNVIDMEAFALAYVAQQYSIPFVCLKYITDGSDESASKDWQSEVKNAAHALRPFFN